MCPSLSQPGHGGPGLAVRARVHGHEMGVKNRLGRDTRRSEAGDTLEIRTTSQEPEPGRVRIPGGSKAGDNLEVRNQRSDVRSQAGSGGQEIKLLRA